MAPHFGVYPMLRASTVAALLLTASLIAQPTHAQEAPRPVPGQAEFAAEKMAQAVRFSAPLSLADFAGVWGRHGFALVIKPDGTAEANWRTYDINRGDSPSTPKGKATIVFTRTEGRTAYGTVSGSTDDTTLPNGSVTLTEHDYGIGELTTSPRTRSPLAPATAPGFVPPPDTGPETLCGPRYADAPAWFTRVMPCGA